jgi:2-oxoglutarate dehydrogenase complex dehydrogenase (E1) component-like enzyme
MAPLLEVLTHKRLEENSSSSAKLQSSFSKILQDQLFKAEHISIHDNDAATLEVLINSYCNHIGYEFDHCNTEAERNFFVSAIEDPQKALSKEGFILFEDDWIFEQLYRTELFERLMHERYSNARTFGIEGMETASLAINVIAETFAQQAGNQSPSKVILGTTHRGRINFLANCLKLPWTELMASWCETNGPTYDDICLPNHRSLSLNQNCQLVLLPIPAHLEAMVPGLLGYARAYASQQAGDGICRGDSLATNMVLPLSLHGDSSFCGEGIIQETLQLGTCQHYQCGGTIHIILNNQIGYTTELSSIKSGSFKPIQSSDIAKSIGAPVLHVNANQPRAVVQACQIAVLYRQKFGADVVIDVVGWRKLGHK